MRNSLVMRILTLSTLVALSGCGKEDPIERADKPSVLLISIDTLRAQSVGLYGYPRPTTPNLDAFAKDSIVFDSAYTPEPQTLPSHTSLLTGLYPNHHGVLPSKLRKLAPSSPTLTRTLQDGGFHTGGFVNVTWLAPQFGLDQGFDTYDFYSQGRPNPNNKVGRFGRSAEETCSLALNWIDDREGAPFFAFVHLFDVHSDVDRLPYESPELFRERFAAEKPLGFDGGRNGVYASEFLNRVNARKEHLEETERAYIQSLYDAGVAYTDECIGQFLDALKERKCYDDLIIIIVADHGEEFMEHGRVMHTQIYEETVRVPFLMRLPQGQYSGRRISTPVCLVDVAPTVSSLLDLDYAPVDGKDLRPLIERPEAWPSRPIPLNHDLGSVVGWREGNIKIISHSKFMESRIFRLDQDPSESSDLAAKEASLAHEMRESLESFRNETTPLQTRYASPIEVDEETILALKKLGYGIE